MNVSDLMTIAVKSCGPHDTLQRAAQIMWENDCGVVPVVDGDGRVVGMITDRDVCMAASLASRSGRFRCRTPWRSRFTACARPICSKRLKG